MKEFTNEITRTLFIDRGRVRGNAIWRNVLLVCCVLLVVVGGGLLGFHLANIAFESGVEQGFQLGKALCK